MNACNEAAVPMMAARERLATLGWIPPRSEYFHHLPPPAADVWLGDGATQGTTDATTASDGTNGWQIDTLDQQAQAQVAVQWLDTTNPAQRKALFDGTAALGDSHQDRFAWAHQALCRHGLRLTLGGDKTAVDAPVRLALHRSATSALEAPTLVIDVAPHTHAVLVETHAESNVEALVQNLQIHVRVSQGARLQHVRIVTPGTDSRIAHQIHASVAEHGRYDQILVANGSSYHQQRTELDLASTDSEAFVGGALFISGRNTLDQQVEALHGATQTRSDLQSLMLASGRARGVINIMTRMAQGVRQAWTLQRLSGIPTGGGQPRVTLRPHLEICHDQVEAEHGATWGALPEDALFYARQRGLEEQTARALIVQGMLTALLAHVLDDDMDLLASLGVDQHLAAAISTHLDADVAKPETQS